MDNNRNISFENKLHSISHDFELKPAADSWNMIEAHLEKQTKRRFFFWLFPIGALMLAGVFVFNNYNDDKKINDNGSSATTTIEHKQEARSEFKKDQKNSTPINDKKNKKENDEPTLLTLNGGAANNATIKNSSNKSKRKSLLFVKSINQEDHTVLASAEIVSDENEEMIKINMLNASLSNDINLNLTQTNFEEIKKPERIVSWSFGLSYSPMFTNRTVNYDFKNNGSSLIEDTAYKMKDQFLFTNNFGADVYYHFNEKFFLHTGVYVINYGEKTFYDNRIYAGLPTAPTNLTAYADYIAPGSETEIINKYSFVQVPVDVGLALRTGAKTSLNIETGFSYGYLIKVRALQMQTISDSLQLDALDDAQLNRMSRNHLFGNASISFDWYILKNISWRNGFISQFQLTDMYKKGELQSQHNYGYGFHTGLIFHFK